MLAVDTTPIDFGGADIGERLIQPLIIQNTGTAAATVAISVAGDRPIYSTTNSVWVPAGSMSQVDISFLPYATGQFAATITLTSGSWTQTITARGETYTALRLGKWGQGTIVGSNFTCASSGCDTRFVQDTTVMAVPDAGHQFVAWSDPTCGVQQTCTVHQEAIGRVIKAYFAPQSSIILTVTFAGSAAGRVSIDDATNHKNIASCRSSCQVPLPAGATIWVTGETLSQMVGLSGACAGEKRCSFTASASTSLTATFARDSKELWSRELERAPGRAVSYDSQGNLLVLTDNDINVKSRLIKLDPTGRTLWAHPGVVGSEIHMGPSDRVIVRTADTIRYYDADGYSVGADSFEDVDPILYNDPSHFRRRLVTTTNGHRVLVGNKNNVTNVQILGFFTTQVINAVSMQVMRGTSALLYVGVGNNAGGMDVRLLDYTGVAQGMITDVNPAPGTFDLMPQGDIVSASSTTSAAVLRRKNASTTVFTRTVPLQYTTAGDTAVVSTSGDRVFWLYTARSPVSVEPNGYNAEIVDAGGNVTWSIARPVSSGGPISGVEIYAAEGNGTDVAIAGSYRSIAGITGGSSTQQVVFGEGFVHVFRP